MSWRIETGLSESERTTVKQGLTAFAETYTGPRNYQPLELALRDEKDIVRGGLLGNTLWNWLRIDVLWIEDGARGLGLGQQLIAAAEAEAVRRGCVSAMVDTFSFEAVDFYRKLGYRVASTTKDFPEGFDHVHLLKDLRSEAPPQP